MIVMETEQIFDKMNELSSFLGTTNKTVKLALNSNSHYCKGYHIVFQKNYDKNNNPWFGKKPFSDKREYKQKSIEKKIQLF